VKGDWLLFGLIIVELVGCVRFECWFDYLIESEV